jgi:hypothetical protein
MDCYGMKTRKARKVHKCCECRGVIKRGESYHYHHGIFDNEPVCYKVCVDCDALREIVDSTAELQEDRTAFECLCDNAQNEPANLMAYIRIRMKRGGKIMPWMQARVDMAGSELPAYEGDTYRGR